MSFTAIEQKLKVQFYVLMHNSFTNKARNSTADCINAGTRPPMRHSKNWFFSINTHICAILGQRSICLLPNLLPVHLGCTTIILGVGVVRGAAMLAEE